MDINNELKKEYANRMGLGDKAKRFIESDEWKNIIKPIIDSMVKGLESIKDINLDSDKSATIEIEARRMAIMYIESIEELIKGYIIDGEEIKKVLDRRAKEQPTYKTK